MKKLLLICFAISVLFGNACNISRDKIELFPLRMDGEFQYINREGEIIINPQFSEASIFRNGLALVKNSGSIPLWGFINEKGKYQIKAIYKSATIFNEDRAWVVLDNNNLACINTDGKIVFILQDAEIARIFSAGKAAFCDDNSKWGFVSTEGTKIITPQFHQALDFHEGKCAVQNENNKWGYISNEGKLIVNYQFEYASNYVNGKAIIKNSGKFGVIDDNGKFIINPQFSNLVFDDNLFLFELGGKWGWCDNSGRYLINPQFDAALPYRGGEMAPVMVGTKFGFVDKDGNLKVNPQFEFALPYNGDLALVSSGKKIGVIDEDGKFRINPQYAEVSTDLIEFLTSGGSIYYSVATSNPKGIALKYLNALKSMDYEGAKKFSTGETGKMLDMLASFSGMMPDSLKDQAKSITVTINDAKEEGDKCVVRFSSSDKPGSEETINLVKKDEKWLVNMTKDDMSSD